MRLIPGNTKVQIEIFNGISLMDLLVGAIELSILALLIVSNIPYKWVFVAVHFVIAAVLLAKIDKESNYHYLLNILSHYSYKRKYDRFYDDAKLINMAEEGKDNVVIDEILSDDTKKTEGNDVDDLTPVLEISDGHIKFKGNYYGIAFNIPDIEFKFFSEFRRANSIENSFGAVLRSSRNEYCTNILKIERPVDYREYESDVNRRIDEIKDAYAKGVYDEGEMKARLAVLYQRLEDIQALRTDNKIVIPYYYLIIFESDLERLESRSGQVISSLENGEIHAKRLDDRELAVMLKYSNSLDFDENEIDKINEEDYVNWSMPQSICFTPRTAVINDVTSYTLRSVSYPSLVGDSWLAPLVTFPSTKVMIKFKPMDSSLAIKSIDKSLSELRAVAANAKTDSKALEAQTHIETLQTMLITLKNNNEILLSTNIYVTGYDINLTNANIKDKEKKIDSFRYSISGMKKLLRRSWLESGIGLNNLEFQQVEGYIASQVSAYDPFDKKGRGIPSNTLAAGFPWIFPHVSDDRGFCLGKADGVPVFMNFFARNYERVNSNVVIIGKSGSGKSFATKTILTNLAADNAKIYILDPENEYADLAANLNGKFINVASNENGIINPFHIIADLEDDAGGAVKTSYSSHLQFLEEFFRMILPDCDKDSLEYLNTLTERVYKHKGIGPDTDVTRLAPEDYPTFDDLYDEILIEFQRTSTEYIKSMLRTLLNYVSKFSEGGRNSQIWNGPSSLVTDQNFTVFNFQGLLSNQNSLVANAQMLLVLKYLNNEIIKNRQTNEKYGLDKKIVLVIDEAHVFIDEKYPIALDFMFQMAKRIRKYKGMQIVITQNIKDFVGSEEIARKSTAIINACQYSFIFSLSPNDMDDLCKLYDKAGKINEFEQEQIIQAPKGHAFVILSPSQRTSFTFSLPSETRKMFYSDYRNPYFDGNGGDENWHTEMGNLIEKHDQAIALREETIKHDITEPHVEVRFTEETEEEFREDVSEERRFPEPIFENYDAPVENAASNNILDARTGRLLEGIINRLSDISNVIADNNSSDYLYRINLLNQQVQRLSERLNTAGAPVNAAVNAPASVPTPEPTDSGKPTKPKNTIDEYDSFFSLFDSEDSGLQDQSSEDKPSSIGNIFDFAKSDTSVKTEKIQDVHGDNSEPSEGYDIFKLLEDEAEAIESDNKIFDFINGVLDVPSIDITLSDLINYCKSVAGRRQ